MRCDPYEQHVAPGDEVRLEVVYTNHSAEPREATCRPVLPPEWGVEVGARSEGGAARAEFRVPFAWIVPRDAAPGRYVVPVDVNYAGRRLGQFREAIVVVV